MNLATLDRERVTALAESFPGNPWESMQSRTFVADRGETLHSNWQAGGHVDGVGGVYAFLLPVEWFHPTRTLSLHAPHSHRGEKIPFQFTLPELMDGLGVIYVGRTINLCQRWRGHLSRGDRNDGGQVKFGLWDCGVEADVEAALRRLRQHARIIYTPLSGPENCANRDLLELSLCARFAPPFNLKSER